MGLQAIRCLTKFVEVGGQVVRGVQGAGWSRPSTRRRRCRVSWSGSRAARTWPSLHRSAARLLAERRVLGWPVPVGTSGPVSGGVSVDNSDGQAFYTAYDEWNGMPVGEDLGRAGHAVAPDGETALA